ncbi:NPCBM/NEW2 domain-containing protein [Burkholderia oklahomensis]|nr:NPCBM/NEW2 domain-containing protein [Burkholderia oklahomensis]MBI0360548.1 NPCBM/NEW2 domain-containing protein [Burkholderia oklahomensis]QPS37975.1 NPCBM/NEW2 domain-containing protein [Burkholderia oklahomensis]
MFWLFAVQVLSGCGGDDTNSVQSGAAGTSAATRASASVPVSTPAASIPASAAAPSPDPFPAIYKVIDVNGNGSLPAPKTVPMGWNAWNTFRCDVSEALIKAEADAIVSSGLKDAGYQYINLDDCWMGGRDATTGQLISNPTTFPSGIKALADYVHNKGLKLGIYQAGNTETCAVIWDKYRSDYGTGSVEYEALDAETFAAWGVDYVKYDHCNGPSDRATFSTMRDALAATGRNIFYSINLDYPGTNGSSVDQIAHTARVAPDVRNSFSSLLSEINASNNLIGYAMPGYWNDMDMLEVGNLANDDQNRVNMSMWAIMGSPLIIGTDVQKASASTLAILTNSDVIAVSQDPLNMQAAMVHQDITGLQVWSKPLYANGQRAVALLNQTGTAANITVKWTDLGLSSGAAQIRDLWAQADLGTTMDQYTASVPANGVIMLKVTGTENSLPTGSSSLVNATRIYAANSYGPVEINMSNGEAAQGDGTPLSIAGVAYKTGFGTNAPSQIGFRLNGFCTSFTAQVGVDDYFNSKSNTNGHGNIVFQVWGDGRLLTQSDTMKPGASAATLTADVTSVSVLRLIARPADNSNWFDYADWVSPMVTCQ